MMSIGTRIKEQRERLGLSRVELAKMIGVGSSAISNYENAESYPKIEVMYRLFEALQCDANFLFQDEMAKPTTYPLSDCEADLVSYAKTLSDENREKLLRYARGLSEIQEGEELLRKVESSIEKEDTG